MEEEYEDESELLLKHSLGSSISIQEAEKNHLEPRQNKEPGAEPESREPTSTTQRQLLPIHSKQLLSASASTSSSSGQPPIPKPDLYLDV